MLVSLALFGQMLHFIIRGYIVTEDALLVRHLVWKTRVPLHGLVSVQVDPKIHTWRNIFHLFGTGRFRWILSDNKNYVVLRFENCSVVITPSDPEEFVRDITAYLAGGMKSRSV